MTCAATSRCSSSSRTRGLLGSVCVGVPVLLLAVACSGTESDATPGSESGGTSAATGGGDNGGSQSMAGSGNGGSSMGGASAAGGNGAAPGTGGNATGGGGTPAGTGGSATNGGASPGTGGSGTGGAPTLGTSTTVHLVPQSGVSGSQRVNFGVPLQIGQLADADKVTVLHGGTELQAGRRALVRFTDGSIRSVQIQFDLDASGETDVEVRVGQTPTTSTLPLVSVDTTLVDPNGESGPRVWALLPSSWLSGSGFAGPLVPVSEDGTGPGAAWTKLCDYDNYDVDAFLA
jgi:hypothetical protein